MNFDRSSRVRLGFILVTACSASMWVACGSDAPVDGVDGGDDSGSADATAPKPDAGVADASKDSTTSDAKDAGDAADAADAASDAGDGGLTLDGGACVGTPATITATSPQFVYTGSTSPISIQGMDFVATPQVFLKASGGALTQLSTVSFLSSTSLTAKVPTGVAAGTYEIIVINPDGCVSSLWPSP